MKKIKLFTFTSGIGFWSVATPDQAALESQVNEFLAKDGNEIKVLDVNYRIDAVNTQTIASVMVYYEEIS